MLADCTRGGERRLVGACEPFIPIEMHHRPLSKLGRLSRRCVSLGDEVVLPLTSISGLDQTLRWHPMSHPLATLP